MQQVYLIVEESKFFSDMLRTSIEGKVAFPIVVTHSQKETQALIDTGKYVFAAAITSLILADSPDGEIVDLLIEHGIPTIVLTSLSVDEVKSKLLIKNIVDYVFKHELVDIYYLVNLLNRINHNSGIKILVVDDSHSTRQLIMNMLQAHRYNVVEAIDGQQALDVIRKEQDIRLVITDFDMPVMDGIQLVRNIRKNYNATQLPIIGLTSVNDTSVSINFLKNGANDFLHKPFRKEIFYCRINQNIDLLEYIQYVKEYSYKDFLTGLPNRKYFFEKSEPIFRKASLDRIPIVMATIDIDHFKIVNDLYGHDGGDTVLKKAAAAISACLRKDDLIARFGGEEFTILLNNTSPLEGRQILEAVRIAVEQTIIQIEYDRIHVTVSIGAVSTLVPTIECMLSAADELLYQAKDNGRNQLVFEQ